MNVLLTGGSGFLGSALALRLHRAGHPVALLLRPASRLERLRGLDGAFDLGRCATDDALEAFVRRIRPDVTIHTACAYGRRGESMVQLTDANQRLGLALLQALERIDRPVTFINTGTVLAPDVSPYALSKHQFARWGRFLADRSGGRLRFVNVLLQHMYGPGDDTSKFTAHVLHACHRNRPALELSAGEQRRDFIYIDDVVDAYLTLLERGTGPAPDIEVGSGSAPTVREFVETVHRLTASRTELLFGARPYRTGEAMHHQADIAYMRSLGWAPKFDLETGLRKTIDLEFAK